MELRDLVAYLAEQRNLDFRGYKTSSLERRFRHRMFQLRIADFGQYARYIERHPAELDQLLNTVLINVTRFFRDPQAWDFLRRHVLPQLTEGLRPGDTFRAWSAGCATGEEAYSLALLLAERFGDALRRYDVKLYGTDIDEEALAVARRAEYPPDKLDYVPAELRARYFVPAGGVFRVQRDVRRLAIFGRSNLAADAPISHVHLILCRNVLIYFDTELQKRILKRFHYALEPGGILVLGKAETQLAQSALFEVVHPRWRVFRRITAPQEPPRARTIRSAEEDLLAKARHEYDLLKAFHESILETLETAIFVLDSDGLVVTENEAAQRIWALDARLTGRKLTDTDVVLRCPELPERIAAALAAGGRSARFECSFPGPDGETRVLAVTIKPMRAARDAHAGILLYAEDVTSRERLQSTIEELETTSEELQSTNEELETTNEELQSTNEELETTNEELQSTNEELETTNEELQALNEELGTTNEELGTRTRDLDSLNERYSETLEHMPWPVLLIERDQTVGFWNGAAQRAFGLGAKSIIGLQLGQLPVQQQFRNTLVRRYRETLVHHRPRVFRNVEVETNNFRGRADLHLTPLGGSGESPSVLIVIEPQDGSRPAERPRAAKPKSPKQPARKRGARPARRKSRRR